MHVVGWCVSLLFWLLLVTYYLAMKRGIAFILVVYRLAVGDVALHSALLPSCQNIVGFGLSVIGVVVCNLSNCMAEMIDFLLNQPLSMVWISGSQLRDTSPGCSQRSVQCLDLDTGLRIRVQTCVKKKLFIISLIMFDFTEMF